MRVTTLTDGRHGLHFTAFDDHYATFEAHGRVGNGYDWTGVAQYLVARRAPKSVKSLHFDAEAGMLSVTSKEKAAILALAAMLREALADETVLRDAIQNSEED